MEEEKKEREGYELRKLEEK
jgi:hypothetical protein